MKGFALYIIVFFLNVTTFNCEAQGIFNQNGAWIKNQIKQIALWEIYIKDLEKGYAIAKDGLTTIGAIKNGDWHLHIDHFNSLMAVNPAIKKYAKAAEILLLQPAIKKLVTKSDDAYVNAVWAHLMDGCNADVEQLNGLLSPDNYELTDDERIRNIDGLYADMEDKYSFAKSFSNDVKILSLQQLKEKNELNASRLLNNSKIP